MNEVEELYRKAVEYGRHGDVYNAVKLCKVIVRKTPDWSAPYAYLSSIYKNRNEWKPSLHYSIQAVEHNPFNETVWENMAVAATALEDWETARHAWNQLGYRFKTSENEPRIDLGLTPVCLNPATQPEIIEAFRFDPARAVIKSIPQPSSGRRYNDEILIDYKGRKSVISQGRKLQVFDELQLLKSSLWRTFAVVLQTPSESHVKLLAKLCDEAGLGFDNWSNASRFFQSNLHDKLIEYYDQTVFTKLKRDNFLIAVAARSGGEVSEVLKNWEIISLHSFHGLECLL